MEITEKNILLCTIPDGTLESTLKPPDLEKTGGMLIPCLGILRLIDWMNENGICSACNYAEYKNKKIDWGARKKQLLEELGGFLSESQTTPIGRGLKESP